MKNCPSHLYLQLTKLHDKYSGTRDTAIDHSVYGEVAKLNDSPLNVDRMTV